MDLQWQRQVERWLKLMGAGAQPARLRMVLTRGQDRIFISQREGRAALAWSRPVAAALRQPALQRLLTLLAPEVSQGVPLRAWLAQECLWLEATAPRESGAESWYALSQAQRRLLDRVTEAAHG